jgi:hypothetical protein
MKARDREDRVDGIGVTLAVLPDDPAIRPCQLQFVFVGHDYPHLRGRAAHQQRQDGAGKDW